MSQRRYQELRFICGLERVAREETDNTVSWMKQKTKEGIIPLVWKHLGLYRSVCFWLLALLGCLFFFISFVGHAK